MALSKWNPFGGSSDENVPSTRSSGNPVLQLQREMNKTFENFFSQWSGQQGGSGGQLTGWEGGSFTPRIDISEDASMVKVAAELPGMTGDDIEVTATENNLTIQGEKEQESTQEGEDYFHSERSYGFFRRSIPMPSEVNVDRAEAKFDNGLLTIQVPKTEEGKGKKLKVSTK